LAARSAMSLIRRLGAISAAVMAVSALATFGALHVHAFALIPPYWQADEHGVPCGKNSANYPQGMVTCSIGVVTTAALNSHAGWQTTNSNAANEWWTYDSNLATVAFQYDTGSGAADVTVDATDLGGPNANGVILLGQTNYYYFLPNQYSYADIYITTDYRINWCVDANTTCPTSSTYDMQHIMAHELGHGLGLAHPVAGPNSWAVMECSSALGEGTQVQSDDLHGAHYLYSSGSWGSPGGSPC
jgi:Matrixin